jgi:hypothetical protein
MILRDAIEGLLSDFTIVYRVHASRRMFQRDIFEDDVELILERGSVVERYDEDYPLPSLLLSGKTSSGKQLHVVVAINSPERKFIIITVYVPDPLRWTDDFSRRVK